MITATYLLNRTPSTPLQDKTPLEIATGDKPSLTNTKLFGCKAFVQIPKPQRRGKLTPTAWQGMMVGYSTNSPEWVILDTRTNQLRKAYSVVFFEDVKGAPSPTSVTTNVYGTHDNVDNDDSINDTDNGHHEYDIEQGTEPPHGQTELPLRRSTRARHQFDPSYMPSGTLEMKKLHDQVRDDSVTSEDRTDDSIVDEPEAPVDRNFDLTQPEEANLGLCMAMTMKNNLPGSWKQAIHISHWKEAMEREVQELQDKGAWVLVDRTRNMKVLPGVWTYRDKRDENGNIVKHKARWCANGSGDKFTWPPETIYSPVAEISTVRLLFAAAAATGQVVLQADFPNAYLNADMNEDVYVCQPYGIYNHADSQKVCLLRKALYGCPISGKKWHDAIASSIKTLEYKHSVIDHCLFTRNINGYHEILLIYVDDVLVTSSGGKERAEVQLNELENIYDIKRLGKATHMLGIGVHQNEGHITLEQTAHAEKILNETEYTNVKPRGTPWDSQYVGKDETLDTTHTVLFRRILGQLMYLANCTRPDLSYAVGRLASSMTAPCHGDWERIKRLLRYISGTKHHGLTYRTQDKSPTLNTYVDAAYGVDPKRGRSITGYVMHLGNTPVL